eukprot:102039-Pelagomonas_calceolata.AAC.6
MGGGGAACMKYHCAPRCQGVDRQLQTCVLNGLHALKCKGFIEERNGILAKPNNKQSYTSSYAIPFNGASPQRCSKAPTPVPAP